MKVVVAVGNVVCEAHLDGCGYSADVLEDLCKRVITMARMMVSVERINMAADAEE